MHVCVSAVCAHVVQALISIWVGPCGCLYVLYMCVYMWLNQHAWNSIPALLPGGPEDTELEQPPIYQTEEASLALRAHQSQWEQAGKEKFLGPWSPLDLATFNRIYICNKSPRCLHHHVKIFFTVKIHIQEPAQHITINFLYIGQINKIIAAVNETNAK